ncbi:MAG TPA: STM4012 family radical SAM protein [Blastocatellia bacterium]|jgi:oxygen-independent coproporphyrinogen-3 oxidase|nr:STM4012 family radical SAM protein [Blastocatellia bacterium]
MNTFERTPIYAGYAYAYPHKTAYRALDPPIALRDLWAAERRDALFLYLHTPFCEMRCGFCNLFTTVNPPQGFAQDYLAALRRQAARTRGAVGRATFARLAIGGGTPTYLDESSLESLFDVAERIFGVDPQNIPVSVETSPLTAESGKLRLLRERGVDRISVGAQSFIEAEVKAVGRSQKTATVEQALDRIRGFGFATLNIDLIYGLPGQTTESWLESLRAALRFSPEELYLYPLYVRPLTGLGRRGQETEDDLRLACYRAGRRRLLESGYRQVSMRMFQSSQASTAGGLAYCCQNDGMVGLGCGARSYTRGLHYSSEYAVGATGVREILAAYIAKPDGAFDFADYGFTLDGADQRRRFVIQSLLQVEGLHFDAYRARFGSEATDDLPELAPLEDHGLATREGEHLRLTEAGLEMSDAIGPSLYSARVRNLMESYQLR